MRGEHALSVGVIGGGTAGYLTALALQIRCPDVDVVVIESSRVPVIGVGEGTTPTMVAFLHAFLGLDVTDFIHEVQPTWKLGVHLDWGQADGEPFQFPFAARHLVDSYVRTGTINHAGFVAALMNRSAGLHVLEADLGIGSLAGLVPFAYHLDNQRFVAYLARSAEGFGVRRIDAHLVDRSLRPDGSLAAVIADDGRRFEFDMFVDCTGFRSDLLGGAMNVAFQSYQSSLFTDAAVVGSAPHTGALAHVTRSDTLDAGWLWSVPQLEEDRRGYVFSTAHLSTDAAEAEMRRSCPKLGDTRLIRFVPGRRDHWWMRNVVAIGNAYGFVEPLQATALHMIVHEIAVLVQRIGEGIRNDRPLDRDHDTVNRRIASIWDDTCVLIALHYRYNDRRDTPFWKDARAETDLRGLDPVIDEAIDAGSMTVVVEREQIDFHRGVARDIDLLLLGLQLVDRDRLRMQLSDADWDRNQKLISVRAGRALSAAQSVRAAREDPKSVDAREAPWLRAILAGLETPLAAGDPTNGVGPPSFLLLPDEGRPEVVNRL